MAKRNANAVWEGGLKGGKGTMRLGKGAFEGQYSYASRFEEGPGTNPEELVAAAEAGCFSMALSADLENAGYTPKRVQTRATVTLEPVDGKPTIRQINLDTVAEVPGIDEGTFQKFAEGAKKGCPVSRALAAVPEITLNAKLQK